MSAAETATVTPLPLTPRFAAEQLLLCRLERVSLDTYLKGVRFLYRLASHDDDELGLLIPELSARFPAGEAGKTPTIDAALIRRTIRAELILLSSEPLTAKHSKQWLKLRRRQLRKGERVQLFSAAERAVLLPEWAIEAQAAVFEIGPVTARERVENFGNYFAQGKDGFVSTKSANEDSLAYPTPSAVRGVREVAAGLFDKGVTKFKARLGGQIPDWLAPWPGDWEGLSIYPHEKAMRRVQRRIDVEQVKTAILTADDLCAKPFLSRCGMTDIEVAKDPERFLATFPDNPDVRRLWIQNSNVALLIRNRALTLLALVVGERKPQLVSFVRDDLHMPPFEHRGVRARWGIQRDVGALLVTRSEKSTSSDRGAHYAPLPLEVCERLRVLLFVYELIQGTPLDGSDPLVLKDLFSEGPNEGLGSRAMGTAAAALLNRFGSESECSDERAYNIIRRYTDEVILDHFEAYRQHVPRIPKDVDAVTVKEITLGHENVRIDPHTYSGLTSDEGRFVISCYGAELVIQTIYGNVATRFGPDREKVRSELATIKALEQTKARVRAEHAQTLQKLRELTGAGGLQGASDGAALLTLAQRQELNDHRDGLSVMGEDLTEQIDAQRAVIEDLLELPELWVPLADGEVALTAKDVRVMGRELLRRTGSVLPPIRDFYTAKEVAIVLGVDPTSVRDWLNHPNPETISRLCPWVGKAPVVSPNERTPLVAAPAIRRDRIRDVAVWDAFRRALTVWPSGSGWSPDAGAKTKAVQRLAANPAVLDRPRENDLLKDCSPDCLRIFRFNDS